MLYKTITIKGKDYKARLTARAIVDLEKKLGTNPINVFTKMAATGDYLPDLETIILMFHASLQAMEHGISLDKAYELYDDMVEEGNTIVDFINILLDIFKVSGMIPEAEEDNGKNAKK